MFTAPRRLGTAAAATAVAAAGFVATAPASTASSVWDRVAQCESGGNWSINTGNGFYGGLQFHPDTWVGFGGTAYAPMAHQASKSAQITIARKVLAVQGPGAWPVCSVKAGLTRDNGGADPSPAPAPAPAPEPAPAPAPEPAPAPAPEPAPEPAPAPAPEASEPAPAESAAPEGTTHVVQAGDTVAKIAAAYGTTADAIIAANGLDDGGWLIITGQTLAVPGASSAPAPVAQTVTIEVGDTLANLAAEHGTTLDALIELNGISNPDLIIAGETLQVG